MQHFAKTTFALFVVLLASFASAQIPANAFQHIIIVVQENRTPDNIFGYYATSGGPLNCTLPSPFAGADLANWGNSYKDNGPICNLPQPMNNGASFDPGHLYLDWTGDYNSGGMNGFCHTISNMQVMYSKCPTTEPSPYSYIQQSDVAPYFSIASTYGFANYMFQTNEGPSFVAHQFLFTGTSAPVAPGVGENEEWWDFVADNPSGMGETNDSGCASPIDAPWVEPNGTEVESKLMYECYAHDSLVTTSDPSTGDVVNKISSWTYYSPVGANVGPGYIWNAPEAIPEVCYGVNNTSNAPAACGSVNGGTEWNDHMQFYDGSPYVEPIPIFTDIANCSLASISWVIPDLAWSDHPSYDGSVSPALGPPGSPTSSTPSGRATPTATRSATIGARAALAAT